MFLNTFCWWASAATCIVAEKRDYAQRAWYNWRKNAEKAGFA